MAEVATPHFRPAGGRPAARPQMRVDMDGGQPTTARGGGSHGSMAYFSLDLFVEAIEEAAVGCKVPAISFEFLQFPVRAPIPEVPVSPQQRGEPPGSRRRSRSSARRPSRSRREARCGRSSSRASTSLAQLCSCNAAPGRGTSERHAQERPSREGMGIVAWR